MERIGNTGSYGVKRAVGFDEEAQFNIGNRKQHYEVLKDILKYMRKSKLDFCDLGCGTGFFTGAFFDVAPDSQGILIDASPEMLKLADGKLSRHPDKINFICLRFQDINWNEFANGFDVVFSSLAVHHLHHEEKWKLFSGIFEALKPDGWFILYDLICCAGPQETRLIEYLACADMQRRLLSHLELDFVPHEFSIEQLIANDRRIRAEDGDKEAVLEEQVERLKQAGFSSAVLVFLDGRIAGIACRKG